MLEVVAGWRRVVDEFEGRVLIGELYLPFERLALYYGHALTGAHLPFNFALLRAPWHAESLARLIADYEESLPPGGWPNWVLGNHDRPRVASRVGTSACALCRGTDLNVAGRRASGQSGQAKTRRRSHL